MVRKTKPKASKKRGKRGSRKPKVTKARKERARVKPRRQSRFEREAARAKFEARSRAAKKGVRTKRAKAALRQAILEERAKPKPFPEDMPIVFHQEEKRRLENVATFRKQKAGGRGGQETQMFASVDDFLDYLEFRPGLTEILEWKAIQMFERGTLGVKVSEANLLKAARLPLLRELPEAEQEEAFLEMAEMMEAIEDGGIYFYAWVDYESDGD